LTQSAKHSGEKHDNGRESDPLAFHWRLLWELQL
jgi:hypothetical protein